MQLLNSHNDKRERYESEQRRKHTGDDVDAMRLRHRHRVGNISSNEEWKEKLRLFLRSFSV